MALQAGPDPADGAGYSHALITALAQRGLHFSVGYPITEAVRDAIRIAPTWVWQAPSNADGGLREHADDVIEVTGLLDLSRRTKTCPGMRVIVRRELPPCAAPRWAAHCPDRIRPAGPAMSQNEVP